MKLILAITISLFTSLGYADDFRIVDAPEGTLEILEKVPPIVLKLKDPATTKWTCQRVNLKRHCGDGDGCTVILNMTHQLDGSDKTLGIKEHLFMEQADASRNKHAGTYGYTRQLSGGEHYWITGANVPYTIFAPWSWTFMLNYDHAYCPGQGGRASSAYTDPYDFSFLVHPHVASLIIIED
jgi:hypothetical protein